MGLALGHRTYRPRAAHRVPTVSRGDARRGSRRPRALIHRSGLAGMTFDVAATGARRPNVPDLRGMAPQADSNIA